MPNDTQADLTERARAEIKRWAGRVPNGPLVATLLDSDTLFHLAPMLAAFAQSEREAAAVETLHDAADELEGFAEYQESALEKGAVINCAKMLRRLASPPAPQEETR